PHSTLGALQAESPHEPGGGPEQEVDLNKKKKVVNNSIYPDEVIERLARCFYPAILECFNSEEGQRAFAAWQAEQARPTAKEKQDVPAGERPALHTGHKRLFSDRAHPSGCAFLFVLQASLHFSTCVSSQAKAASSCLTRGAVRPRAASSSPP